jgi:hypothetical protein
VRSNNRPEQGNLQGFALFRNDSLMQHFPPRLEVLCRNRYSRSCDPRYRNAAPFRSVNVGVSRILVVGKEEKTDYELEEMIAQRIVVGGIYVSVQPDPVLGWRATVITAPKHARYAQDLADKISIELRAKFTLKK